MTSFLEAYRTVMKISKEELAERLEVYPDTKILIYLDKRLRCHFKNMDKLARMVK